MARVRVTPATEGPYWVGERVVLHVELLSNAAMFAGQLFRTPEVLGGLLQKDPGAPLFLGEQIDGESWQTQRYSFSLFPQRDGTLEVPPIGVSFRVAFGYGQPEHPFELQTQAIQIDVRAPPGIGDTVGLVTTSRLDVDISWEPQSPMSDAVVGDAFTRVIRRRGADLSGMVFAPLTVPEVEGLAAYPQPPQVRDRNERGSLTGERVEAVTFVAQRPGRFEIPGIVVRWWDPESETLEERSFDPVELSVAPNPALGPSTMLGYQLDRAVRGYPLTTAGGAVAALSGVAALWHWRRRLAAQWRAFLQRRADREVAWFAKLSRACRRGSAGDIYAALTDWIVRADVIPTPVTLRSFARAWPDAQLAAELGELQEALVRGELWSGRKLGASLRRLRKANRLEARRSLILPPLNPSSSGLG
jgi:hypothetical protein